MYYYIFDVRKCKNRRQVETIKDYLSDLGISGEYVIPDKIRPARDLAEQGVFKGYSTIVVIGSDELIDEVAAVMLNKQQAFGVVPLGASENIFKIIGATNWEEAATNLRYRKITETKVGVINEQTVFFSYCELNIEKPTAVTIEFEHYMVQAKARELFVANRFPGLKKQDPNKLDVLMRSVEEGSGGIWGLFKNAITGPNVAKNLDLSIFRSDALRIFSPRQIQISVDGRVLTKTPATFGVSQKYIRLITKKNLDS